MSVKGWQAAAGVWFPPSACQPERVLASWQEGSQLRHAWGGMVMVFPSPRWLRAELGAAHLLVFFRDAYVDCLRTRPQPGQLVVRWQGQLLVAPLNELDEVDLAGLWQSATLSYVEGQPLAGALGPPSLMISPETTMVGDVRQVLPSIPPAAPEQQKWAGQLRQPPSSQGRAAANPLLGFFDLLRSFFGTPENQKYVSKMVHLFQSEQWDQALRYAIPIDSGSRDELLRFLGKLQPRSELTFSSAKSAGGGSIGTSLDGVEMLRELYLRAVDGLTKTGRIDEAAFALAELLQDGPAAVALLETHHRYQTAAALATLKGLPASLQVRLWFLAGQTETALQVARRHSVQAQALAALEAKDPVAASAFRLLWANDLAVAGRFAEAVQVGWLVRKQLPGLLAWMEEGLSGNCQEAAQVLALGLTDTELSTSLDLIARLRIWFADDDLLALERCRAFLKVLCEQPFRTTDPGVQQWAGRVARRVIRQADGPMNLGGHHVLNRLIEISADPWLRIDRPRAIPRWTARLDRWSEAVERRGHLAISDAVLLGDGRFLVALGHAGLAVLSGRGAISQRFPIPAHQLVTPLHGDRYVVVSGQTLGIFQNGKVRPWCTADIDGFADQHDGFHWLVWRQQDLYQIDIASVWRDGGFPWRALQRVALPQSPLQVSVSSREAGILMDGHQHFYASPSLALRSSAPIAMDHRRLLTPWSTLPFSVGSGQLHFKSVPLASEGSVLWAEYRHPYGVLAEQGDDALILTIFLVEAPKTHLRLTLPGVSFARVRMREHTAVVSDNLGRLLVADLQSQQWVRQFFL